MLLKNTGKSYNSAGFTVLELAIVLVIIALIAFTTIAVGGSRLEAARVSTTYERMNFIMGAINFYVSIYNALPCPADNTLVLTDANFGSGEGSGDNTVTPGNCLRENGADGGVTNVLTGGVPVRHLNITYSMAQDGWGHRFTYVVDEDLTWPGTGGFSTGGYLDNAELGDITVMNTSGGTIVTSNAAVLLLSHGSDGHGAWKAKGGATRFNNCGVDADQDENAQLPGCGSGFDNVFVQKFRTATFDDIVEYREKWQLGFD